MFLEPSPPSNSIQMKKKNVENVGHLEGRGEGKFFSIHVTFIHKVLIILLLENDGRTDKCVHVYFPVSEQHLLVCNQTGLGDATLCSRVWCVNGFSTPCV